MNIDKKPGDGILPKGCVCGHDHETDRGEHIELCLECSCSGLSLRCQNCGEGSNPIRRRAGFDTCSDRCLLQLEYAASLKAAAA